MSQELLQDVITSYDRLTEDELTNLGIVLGAYRSFRGNRRGHIAYVSMPITTGRRYFDVLSTHGIKTVDELVQVVGKAALWELVIKPNIDEGIAFANALGHRENLLFIAPSIFEAKKWRWTQDAYMSLWYRVIGEMAGRHVVMDGWEYSTGGVKEVMFSMLMQWRVIRPYTLGTITESFGLKNFMADMSHKEAAAELEAMWKIRVVNADGEEIKLDDALIKVVDAVVDLHDKGFPYGDLLGPANTLQLIPMVLAPGTLLYGEDAPSDPLTPQFTEAQRRLRELAQAWQMSHQNN